MEDYRYFAGTAPLLISVPHAGTALPPDLAERLTDAACLLPDTDWHVDKLYEFARAMGANLLVATWSRYVVDLNRGRDDASLYPGKFTTGLCPATRFDATPLYRAGREVQPSEVPERVEQYWLPYHTKLRDTLEAMKLHHGYAMLLDAHSIASVVPTLFEGKLPDLNFGTGDGISAKPALAQRLLKIGEDSNYSAVLNGRFKGGYITRNYGAPDEGVQAVQLELAQCNYMDEQSFAYDAAKAEKLQEVLKRIIGALLDNR